MKIVSFRIENYRNLKLAECEAVPDFMVICGGNGCGKSAIFEALVTAKEAIGGYGYYSTDPSAVSADAETAVISMTLAISEKEREFVQVQHNIDFPNTTTIRVEVLKNGNTRALENIAGIGQLLEYFSRTDESLGFFDYIYAHREMKKQQLQTWDPGIVSDARSKTTLATRENKFQNSKSYLASLKMHDLQEVQRGQQSRKPYRHDSLAGIRSSFNVMFAPMIFDNVYLNSSPFRFVVKTPRGEIDIDDLSSGEKEIFSIITRFHQLKPRNAVILFDEADAHLHPDLERRYLDLLRELSQNSQLLLTTHSPEMMVAAGSTALYTVLKTATNDNPNQFVQVSSNQELHEALSELMGSRGLVSFNQRVVFIEGEDGSADRAIYEALYPPNKHNISFIPAGDSASVRKTAERVNALLSASTGFQQYYSIIDHDIDRGEPDPTAGKRLFRLPVYHVENFLLEADALFDVTREMLGAKCPFSSPEDVIVELKRLITSDGHLKPYTAALLDARIALLAKQAYDAVTRRQPLSAVDIVEFPALEKEALNTLESSIKNDNWRIVVKGRDLIKAYCKEHGLTYEHFRNLLIARLKAPPEGLAKIMDIILEGSISKTPSKIEITSPSRRKQM